MRSVRYLLRGGHLPRQPGRAADPHRGHHASELLRPQRVVDFALPLFTSIPGEFGSVLSFEFHTQSEGVVLLWNVLLVFCVNLYVHRNS